MLSGIETRYNLYNLVFCVVLLSIALQGSLLPKVAARLQIIDHNGDVAKTFSDYQEESNIDFIKIHIDAACPLVRVPHCTTVTSPELMVTMIVRWKANHRSRR